jgi:hypothetical protein
MDVVPGTRVADRLGSQLAISSRPIVVASRGGTSVQQSLRDYVREAPRTIQRTTDPATQQRLEPVLARDRVLPASTQEALRSRVAVADRGRLTGPGAAEIAPRGAPIANGGTGSSSTRIETDAATGRTVVRNNPGTAVESAPGTRGGTAAPSDRFAQTSPGTRGSVRPGDTPAEAAPAWRSRGSVESGRPDASRPAPDTNVTGRETREHWRTRTGAPPSPAAQAPTRDFVPGGTRMPAPERGGQDWRSRGTSSVPPARRVIEGSVPGRRTPYPGAEHGRPQDFTAPRRGTDVPRNYASPPPSSRGFSAPPPHEAPRPSAPREMAPPPRSAPAPAPHAPSHSAPPPAPRSAPSGGGGHRPPGR